MARPKKKPSQKQLVRQWSKKSRRLRPTFFDCSVDGPTVWTSTANTGTAAGNVVLTSGTSASGAVVEWGIPERLLTIESLDEGVTWHATDTLQPVANLNGQIAMGSAPYGPAPECMRPGSGTYSFTITVRRATEAEAAEWIAGRAVQEDELNRQQEEARVAHEKAESRARELLLSHLTTSQRSDLETKDGFWVLSQFMNRYWVTRRTAVRFDDRGAALQRYCIHAVDDRIPADDNALARKLLLECDEEAFLRMANPGTPSEFDIGRLSPVNTMFPQIHIGTGTSVVATTAGSHGAFTFTPLLLWANGVVRPLCG